LRACPRARALGYFLPPLTGLDLFFDGHRNVQPRCTMYYMAKPLLTVRMDQDRLHALDKVADGIDRDRTYVVTQAIDAFLDVQKWQIEYIEEAMREAEAGKFASAAAGESAFARLRGRSRRWKAG